jgi:hypothetical protein
MPFQEDIVNAELFQHIRKTQAGKAPTNDDDFEAHSARPWKSLIEAVVREV